MKKQKVRCSEGSLAVAALPSGKDGLVAK